MSKVTDITASVWVSASAGTGKTKNLIDRIMSLLLHGISPSRILCLTYTKAAAQEMFMRLDTYIKKWRFSDTEAIKSDLRYLGIDENLYTEVYRLQQYVIDGEAVRIQTIHSFCQSILEQHHGLAGLSSDFSICDERDRMEILRGVYNQAMSEEFLQEDFYTAIFHKPDIFRNICNSLSDIKKFLENQNKSDVKEIFRDFFQMDSDEQDEHKLLLNLFQEYKGYREDFSKLAEAFQEEKPEYARILRECISKPSNRFTEIFLTKDGIISQRIMKKTVVESFSVSEQLKRVSQFAFELKESQSKVIYFKVNVSFFRIAQYIIQKYQEVKKSCNIVDYDDLIGKTLDLLRSDEREINLQLDHLLVDEAQDTSVDQWKIIQLLVESFTAKQTVFVVGDKKQSIYSFQGADYTLFGKMHDYFQNLRTECGQKWHDVSLTKSYRSGEAVIDFVNKAFCKVFDGEDHSTARIGENSSVVIHPPVSTSEDPLKLSREIAAHIADIIRSGAILPSRNRAAEPRDFMILFQKRSDLISQIIKELKSLGIPCSGNDKINLTDELIVEDLMCLAEFCLNPYDELTFARLLKSPIVSISDTQLQELCLRRGDHNLWEYFASNENSIIDGGDDILQKLNSYRKLSRDLSVYEFFLSMKINGDADILIKRLGGNSHEAFLIFLDVCAQYQEKYISHMHGFLQWLRREEIILKKEEELHTNSVRILTAHGSKGLQTPVVILADATSYGGKSDSIVYLRGECCFVPIEAVKLSLLDSFKDKIKEQKLQESDRLLYVAATRAEDCLMVFGAQGDRAISSNSWYQKIIDRIGMQDIRLGNEFDISPNQYSEESYTNEPSGDAIHFDEFSKSLKSIKIDEKSPQSRYGEFVHLLLADLPYISEKKRLEYATRKSFDIDNADRIRAYKEVVNLDRKYDRESRLSEVSFYSKQLRREGRMDEVLLDQNSANRGPITIIDFKTGSIGGQSLQNYNKQLEFYKSVLSGIVGNDRVSTKIIWTSDGKVIEFDHIDSLYKTG